MNDLQFKALCLLILAAIIATFGGYCVHEGHNSTIILSVFTALGVIGGYIYGKRQKET